MQKLLKNQIVTITAVKNLKTYAKNQGDLKGLRTCNQNGNLLCMPIRSLKSNTTDKLHYYIFSQKE
jgi:hypothetical protein